MDTYTVVLLCFPISMGDSPSGMAVLKDAAMDFNRHSAVTFNSHSHEKPLAGVDRKVPLKMLNEEAKT